MVLHIPDRIGNNQKRNVHVENERRKRADAAQRNQG